jgi:hypothetical protein
VRLALATVLAVAAGVLVGAVVVGGLGVALGYALFADDEPETGLPASVLETHAALLEAAESGDYEELRPLVPASGFTYTFGEPAEDGPIAYWQRLETTRPAIEILAEILRMPYTLSRGYYVWPFAYDVASAEDLSAHERELLEPLGPLDTLFAPGTGYLGWRAGIAPDGTWTFFVAGD